MRMQKRRSVKVTDVTRKLQSRVFSYLGEDDRADHTLAAGADIPDLIRLHPDTADFRRAYLASEMMSKYPALDLGIRKDEAAVTAFLASEKLCLDTNIRLQRCAKATGIEAVISTAGRLLCSLLGDFDLNEMSRNTGFSGGASTRLRRRFSMQPMKYSAKKKLHVTRDCLPYAVASIGVSPIWSRLLIEQNGSIVDSLEIVAGNRITTVPKNAKTDRIIAIEPDMNMYIQKGIGAMIRKRLRLVGINLNSQERNQQYALLGSKNGDLATIDLKAASDTISIELVRLLVPDSWFRHLMATRSPCGVLPDGRLIPYQKISSMGNGYTFELESAIFWCLSKAVIMCSNCEDRRLSVYGDDIILNSSCVELLREVFTHSGFTFNVNKSFWTGPFRESCGKHYHGGVDVTPFYIRRPIDSVVRLYWLCNQFRRWCCSPLGFGSQHSYETWRVLRNHIPKRWQLVIPDGIGDVGLLGSLSESKGMRKCIGLIPIVDQVAPGAELMYICTQDQIQWRTSPIEKCSTADSEMLSKVVPDRHKLNRFRLVGWADPYPWISDLVGPVGLV